MRRLEPLAAGSRPPRLQPAPAHAPPRHSARRARGLAPAHAAAVTRAYSSARPSPGGSCLYTTSDDCESACPPPGGGGRKSTTTSRLTPRCIRPPDRSREHHAERDGHRAHRPWHLNAPGGVGAGLALLWRSLTPPSPLHAYPDAAHPSASRLRTSARSGGGTRWDRAAADWTRARRGVEPRPARLSSSQRTSVRGVPRAASAHLAAGGSPGMNAQSHVLMNTRCMVHSSVRDVFHEDRRDAGELSHGYTPDCDPDVPTEPRLHAWLWLHIAARVSVRPLPQPTSGRQYRESLFYLAELAQSPLPRE